jgi:hypothetical protein
MISFHVPDDPALLSALGHVTLRHEHLNHCLRMTIKTLANLTVEQALDATAYDGSRQLRQRITKLARRELGEGQALLKLQALLERCRRATDARNELIHGIWAKELDGEPVRRSEDHSWHPLPSERELLDLAEEMRDLTENLNTARLEGFIAVEFSERRGQK